MMGDPAGLSRSDADGVAWLTLDRPERRNALTTDVLRQLCAELVSIEDDPAVRVVVLAGEGGTFCSGADVHEFGAEPQPEQRLARIRLVIEAMQRIQRLAQPTIAAVHGPALGAGWGLALACDLCFASADAVFCLPEVAKGYRIPGPLVDRLRLVVGPVRAAEIVLGGATYGTEQAVAAGWVTRVFADRPDLVEQTRSFATGLASRPPDYVWIEE